MLGEHRCGDLGDVLARVAVLRRRLGRGRGEQRRGEPVDLGAGVVEVVLAGHPAPVPLISRPSASPTAAHRALAEVTGRSGWPRRTRRSPAARAGVGAAVRRPAAPRRAASCPARPRRRDVEEPGPATSTASIPRSLQQPVRDAGEVARGQPRLLGQLERYVGGVVAVTPSRADAPRSRRRVRRPAG